MSNKRIYHITALSTKKNIRVDLYFTSIKEAAFHNPTFTDFRLEEEN